MLRGGLHFGLWAWQYRIHSVPLVTVPQGKIGYVYARDGEAPLFVPAAAVLGTGTASGMAGKFVERDGLVVLTWSLGGTPVDTGFRTRRAADRRRLLAALEALAPGLPA